VCGEAFTDSGFNARNMHMHLITKHKSFANKPLQFFERKLLEIHKQSDLVITAITTVTAAYFEVSYLLPKNKKPHTFGETLLLPVAMKVCK
jgi:hypothetical protein